MSTVDVDKLAGEAGLYIYCKVGSEDAAREAWAEFASLVLEAAVKACEDVQEGLGHSHGALGAWDCVRAVRDLKPVQP